MSNSTDTTVDGYAHFRMDAETRAKLREIAVWLAARKRRRGQEKRPGAGRPPGGLSEALRVAVQQMHARLFSGEENPDSENGP